jgi:hypothetical protein
VTGDIGERQTGTGLRITPGSSAHLPSETQTPKEVKVEEVKVEAKDINANANTNDREGSEIRQRKGLNNIAMAQSQNTTESPNTTPFFTAILTPARYMAYCHSRF